MSHDHQDAKSVFLHALELQSPARGQFLDQACQGDPHLRERVDELLRSFAEAESFLEQRAAAVFGSPAAATPQAGDTIGPYKLLEQIGEGGMGVVYMAEQTEPVQRRVALKIIKPGMDTRQVIARFEAERQALAIMDHVNIARVIDAGTTDGGRPYFVMELVHGVPITQYCDDNHLTPRQRLDLFVPVCQAIQHAHQKGIIHRDIKPSNVMVTLYDGKPVPKVIDFGVAKATEQKLTERTLFTQYGTLVGTLEYMSPEQAEMSALGVDTRSDIYSLGVLLYELLTGSTPLSSQRMKEAGYAEILRLIKEEEPPKPSTRLSESGESLASISAQRHTEPAKLSRLMRGELDWIVMKCLEKDRNRRYETANGFASDVQRYLADEPVQACPPSAAYRFRKFAKRNKRVLAMMLLVVAALVGGVMATTWQALRATQAEQRALADRDAKSRALEAERQARQEATQASVQTLEALRAMTDVTVTRQLGGQVQLTDQDRAFFTQIIARFEGLAAVRGDGAESRALRAEGNYRAGYMRYHLQEWRDALPAFERARNVYGDLAADFPADPAYRSGLAGSHKLVGEVLVQLGRSHEAEAAYRLAISQFQRLGIDFSASPESRPGIVATRGNLAGLLSNQGRLAEAEAEFRLALAAAEELQSDMPPVRSHRQLLITRHLNLGIFLWERQRKQAEGEAEIRRALALQTELAAESPDQPKYYDDLATCHHHLGRLLAAGGQPTDATAQYRAALVIENKLAADFPAVPRYRQTLAKTYLLLGIILADQEMPAEAQAQYRRALALQQPLVEDFPDVPAYADQLAKTYHRLGINLESQHLSEEAIDVYRRAQALWAELSADFPAGPDFHWNLANCRRQLGMLLAARGHLADAEAEYRAAIAIETELVAEFAAVALYHRSLASTYRLLGNVLTEEGNVADGVAEYRRALVPLKRLVDEFPGVPDYREQLTLILSRLGAALEKEGDLDNAKECYGEAIELYTTLAADLPLETRYTRKLVKLLAKSGRGQEIEGVQRDAIARLEKVTVADSQMHAYRQALGQRYEEIGEWDKAAAEYTRALELRHDVEELWTRRAAAQFQLQRWKEAAADYSQAIARAPKVHTNWYHRGHAHLQLAEWEKAASDFTEIVTGWPAEPGGWYLRAISCAQLNKPEQAMADLRQAVAAGFNDLEGMKHEPRLEPLRSTKDYKELLAELEARNSSP